MAWKLATCTTPPSIPLICSGISFTPSSLTFSSTFLLTSLMVSVPLARSWSAPTFSTDVLLNVMCGYFSASNQSPERRWLSRFSLPVFTLATLICTSIVLFCG